MENFSKQFYVLPDTTEVIWSIVNTTHTRANQPTKGKTVIPPRKNPGKMVPKYQYILHYLLKEAIHNTKEYQANGVGICQSYLKKRISEDGPTTSLMLRQLELSNLIEKVKKHSHRKSASFNHAAKYKLVNADLDGVTLETFTHAEHGIFIRKQVTMDQKYQKEVIEFLEAEAAEAKPTKVEPVTFNKDLDVYSDFDFTQVKTVTKDEYMKAVVYTGPQEAIPGTLDKEAVFVLCDKWKAEITAASGVELTSKQMVMELENKSRTELKLTDFDLILDVSAWIGNYKKEVLEKRRA